jgi:hypothetical protein
LFSDFGRRPLDPLSVVRPLPCAEAASLVNFLDGSAETGYMNMVNQPTRAVEDYLKAIHRLGGVDKLVTPVDLAARMQVRAASVT